MKKTGVFYEIGAAGQYLSYLLDPDWKAQTEQRLKEQKPIFAPTDLCEQWVGYFVEPLARPMVEMLKWNRWDNAHYVQCAVAGSSRLRKASIIEFLDPENPWDMATLADSSFYTTWAKEVNSYYIPTVTLDELFSSLGAPPDLLRLDIEGLEIETLLSFSFDPKPRIIQIDHHAVSRDTCCEILRDQGYNIVSANWMPDRGYDDACDIYAECENEH